MENNNGKRIKIEFNELTLWRLGTIVFGLLFVISFFGKSSGTNEVNIVDDTAPTAIAQQKVDVKAGDAYVKGKSNAKVEIIEFSDFECPFCGKFYTETFGQIEKNYVDTGKVKVAFKHLPLPFHPTAKKSAEAAECAGEIGGSDTFWKMHDMIFENQGQLSALAKEVKNKEDAVVLFEIKTQTGTVYYELLDLVNKFKESADNFGLDKSKFNACIDNGETISKIENNLKEASKLGASGTPTFFINGVKVVGAQPYPAFEQAIEAALKN